jgi:alpha-L-fucosidase 2
LNDHNTITSQNSLDSRESEELRYRRPASQWVEALPVGNGRLGAMVFGSVPQERLQLNEETLWAGRPGEHIVPGSAVHLPAIRNLIFQGRADEAEALANQFVMPDVNSPVLLPDGTVDHTPGAIRSQLPPYLPLGDLHLLLVGHDQQKVTDYERRLDLDQAVVTTRYRVDGKTFTREVFASHPDSVIVVHLTCDTPDALNVEITLSCPHAGVGVKALSEGVVRMGGQLQPRRRPIPAPFASECDAESHVPGMSYLAEATVRPSGGTMHANGDRLHIHGATAVTVLLAAATSYVSPTDISGDPAERVQACLAAVANKPLEQLRRAHIADYQQLMHRVRLRLEGSDPAVATLDTDQRLQRFAEGRDPALAALLFNYGRYLLIASSRPGGLPATLQGIWNDQLWPAWGSKWTLNINAQMNYWLAEPTALSECHLPLLDMLESSLEPGRRVAREHYNCAGFVLHHNTDIWRSAGPVDNAIHAWPLAAAWLCLHLWEHYQFTLDLEFLRRRGYPLMKEAAAFLTDFLIEAPAGTRFPGSLVSVPSYSPENSYILPSGRRACFTYAPTMDLGIIRELLGACIEAAGILKQDENLRSLWRKTLQRLPPLQIGKHGQLQEWIEDLDDPQDTHRHVSHLFNLHPGTQISPRGTPSLAAAARRSLELRGDGSTGWSKAWKILFWARLGDGERAHHILQGLLTPAPADDGNYEHGGTYPNLFDAHPPFQIDGNFGGTAGIAEMLLQSHTGELHILPALPHCWRTGQVSGLKARGGFTVDLHWRDGRLIEARVQAARSATCAIRYQDRTITCHVPAADGVNLDGRLEVRAEATARST